MAEWLRARNWTKEYLDKMPEEGYAHKAVPEVRSFAEQMIHLASANFFYAAQASGQQMPVNRADLTPEKYKTKADVTKLVLDSYDFMINAVKGMDMAKLAETQNFRNTTISRMGLVRNGFEHQTHHRGQTTIYLRMKGVTPPPEPFQ
ncbi:MAG: DinB family protein [Blastocatellia bacterium]